ncbi:hypothetical protein PG996_011827 [Apiospora saccharicola]|uniref:Rhodopsin domain-containing protein n=1 Tax=Apiospora saccharicola TaxID=335842 RepID=A0ABR1UIJ4_9PEZI
MAANASIGAVPPPPGVTPNLENPEDVIATINMATQISSICLITPFIALRLYAKAWVAPPFLLDDLGYFGGGHHAWDLSVENYEGFLKALYADSLVYGFSAWFTKFALLLVIGRVFETFKVTRVISWVLIVLLGGFYIAGFIVKAQVRHPIQSYWNLHQPGTDVVSQRAVFAADTVMSTISDLAVLILPIPAVVSLKLPLWKKLKIWSMLGLGGIATMAGIVRLIFVLQFQKSNDQSVSFIRFNLFATAELTIGVICACLPACGILIARSRNSVASNHSSYFSSRSKFMYAIKSIKFSLRTKSEGTTVRRTAMTMPVTYTNHTNATTVVNTTTLNGTRRATVRGRDNNDEEPHPGVNVVDLYLGSWMTPPSTSDDDNGSERTTRTSYLVYAPHNNNTPNNGTHIDVAASNTDMEDTDVERGDSRETDIERDRDTDVERGGR